MCIRDRCGNDSGKKGGTETGSAKEFDAFFAVPGTEDVYKRQIIDSWYPGARGGKAVAEAIFGEYSPSGKLPVTFYQGTENLPEFTDYSMAHRTYRLSLIHI